MHLLLCCNEDKPVSLLPPCRKGFPCQRRLSQDGVCSCIQLHTEVVSIAVGLSPLWSSKLLFLRRGLRQLWSSWINLRIYACSLQLKRREYGRANESAKMSTLVASLDAGLRNGFSTAHKASVLGSLPCCIMILASLKSSVLLGVLLQRSSAYWSAKSEGCLKYFESIYKSAEMINIAQHIMNILWLSLSSDPSYKNVNQTLIAPEAQSTVKCFD